MVIKASSSSEIRQLIEALGDDDGVRREAAIARLSVIGPRAVERLLDTYARTSSRPLRTSILRVLEPMTDPRALGVARAAVKGDADLAVAATGVLRELLEAGDADVAADALDALVAAALDTSAARTVRLAAYEALARMPDDVRARVGTALQQDDDAVVRKGAAAGTGSAVEGAIWEDALEGRLPDDPRRLREAVAAGGQSAPLASLQKLVERLRERETSDSAAAAEWRAVRGAVHQALAIRGSRVALYDLRESLPGPGPLPTSFLSAVQAIGDGSCLEPLAAAYQRADASNERWRQQLTAAARAILKREKITPRSAALKRVTAKFPEFAAAVKRQ